MRTPALALVGVCLLAPVALAQDDEGLPGLPVVSPYALELEGRAPAPAPTPTPASNHSQGGQAIRTRR